MLYLVARRLRRRSSRRPFERVRGGRGARGRPRRRSERIVRQWGTVQGDQRAQMATFGHQVAALEVGRFGPLRVAELFAEERLKRASPALRVGTARARSGAPPRPDERGDRQKRPPARSRSARSRGTPRKALGGLLAASTAAAVAARPETVNGACGPSRHAGPDGGLGGDAPSGRRPPPAAFDALSATPLGLLAGLDRPLDRARVEPFRTRCA